MLPFTIVRMNALTEQIKQLLDGKSPSAYHQTLKSKADLMEFIEDSWTWGEAAFKTKLFHVVSGESPICSHGKVRKVETFTAGYCCTRGCELVVINTAETSRDDLVQDFVSVITSFCSRIYGKRRSKRNTERLIEDMKNAE